MDFSSTLAKPKLDDRQFQDLVDEAKKRIPHYCKEWTDHNVSDPGVTLIELFAWMTDVLLYRLNQVPDLHYIRFLELLGIKLQEPVPAKAPVTFWLSAPLETSVIIPAHTEVASTQTETEPSIVFSTDHDLSVHPPQLAAVLSRVASSGGDKKSMREYNLRRLEAGFEGLDIFTGVPQVDDALYFGFENDLSQHFLGFDFDFDPAGGAGVDPTLPPTIWEVSTGQAESRWLPCEVEQDTTKGLNSAGRIRIHLPQGGKYKVGGQDHFWVRLRVRAINEAEKADGMQPYDRSPRLRQVSVASWGGTTAATHARQIQREFLGQSDGSPGQRFYLQTRPILKRQPEEALVVQVPEQPPQIWKEQPDFASSNAEDRHFTLDSVSGELRLGPAVRQPDGAIKLYGAVPPRGSNLIFARYRSGGGQEGNVQTGILNTLKTAIPFIGRVSNRQPAWGGMDAESLEAASMRAPAMLRSRERAVSESDFEFLARQALPAAIGRVKCLQPRPADAGRVAPGQIYVLVIPRLSRPSGFLEPDQLQLRPEDIALLSGYLDERRLLTTRLDIRPPAYYWVAAQVRLRAAPGADRARVEADVLTRLYEFLNPLTGGPDRKGWEFGRDLFVSDIYQCLQGLPDVQFIRSVEMFNARPGGEPQGDSLEFLELVAHGVVASGQHGVEFV
jgi:predicted phage baseplate assembly protein